jgi:hypothetical protein
MQTPGNHWYHCILSTYGSWVRGDTRGWRSRRHREHVDGDYRQPPSRELHEPERRQSFQQMTRPVVVLTPQQRDVICQAIGEYLSRFQITFAECCVSATHAHLLAQIPPSAHQLITGMTPGNVLIDGRSPLPRHLVGRIKAHTTFTLRSRGLRNDAGGLWGVRSKIIPIRDRDHQLNVVRYIRSHTEEGASVWSFLQQRPE